MESNINYTREDKNFVNKICTDVANIVKSYQNKVAFRKMKRFIMNVMAMTYILGGFSFGLYLLLINEHQKHLFCYLLSSFLIGHTLALSGYMYHDLAHGSIFPQSCFGLNEVFANLMLLLNGGCYFEFNELKSMHITHHVKKVDFEVLNTVKFLNSLPKPIEFLIVSAEYCYIPLFHFILRWRAITSAFWKKGRERHQIRVINVTFLRALLFSLLTYYAGYQALLSYFTGFCFNIQILRFTDCFSHTYDLYPVDTKNIPKHDKFYDMEKTFSSIASGNWEFLNLFFLNFTYHNAHHFKIDVPWCELKEFHYEQLSKEIREKSALNLFDLLRQFHCKRLNRLYESQGNPTYDTKNKKIVGIDKFIGVLDASFLFLEV
ncbi:hypothetical protein ABK040_001328 [Willaertia magna]